MFSPFSLYNLYKTEPWMLLQETRLQDVSVVELQKQSLYIFL